MRRQSNSSDVAKHAGVSRTTVSYVLSGANDVSISPATRERVLQAALELNYRSNRLANGLLRGKTQTIGVIVPYLGGDYHGNIVQGIQEYCRTTGYRILMACSEGDSKIEAEESRLLLEHRVDGIICIASGGKEFEHGNWLEAYASEGIACLAIELNMDSVDCVLSDDVQGIGALVDHVISLGHRRIGFIMPPAHGIVPVRCQAYQKVLADLNLPFDDSWIVPMTGVDNAGEFNDWERLASLFLTEDAPTAWIGNNDYYAVGALNAARRLGARRPMGIVFAGYGYTEIGKGARITTVNQFPQEMGRVAAQRLIQRCDLRDLAPETMSVHTELVVRQSTADAGFV